MAASTESHLYVSTFMARERAFALSPPIYPGARRLCEVTSERLSFPKKSLEISTTSSLFFSFTVGCLSLTSQAKSVKLVRSCRGSAFPKSHPLVRGLPTEPKQKRKTVRLSDHPVSFPSNQESTSIFLQITSLRCESSCSRKLSSRHGFACYQTLDSFSNFRSTLFVQFHLEREPIV